LTAESVSLRTEIQIPETGKRVARQAKLEVRFCQVNLRTPYRFDNRDPLKVYAVYAQEVDQFWILDFGLGRSFQARAGGKKKYR
jgi:hypothetical protein